MDKSTDFLDGFSDTTDSFSDFLDKRCVALNRVLQARGLISAAFPATRFGSTTAVRWHAYDKLKPGSERRVRAIWSGETRRIDCSEMTALQAAALREAANERDRLDQTIDDLKHDLAVLNQAIFGTDAT